MQVSRRLFILIALVGVAVVASAAALIVLQQGSTAEDRGARTVVTSTGLIGEVVYKLTGGKVSVKVLLPPGAEVHEWEPSASDVAAIGRAVLVVYTSDSLEGYMRKMMEASGSRAVVVKMEDAPGVKLIPLDEDDHHEDHHGGVDPHIWLSLENYIAFVRHLSQKLAALFPELRDQIAENERAITGKAEALLNEYRERLSPFRGRPFLTEHLAFRYLAKEFGLKNVAIKGVEEQEPDPQHLVELRNLVISYRIRAIYVDDPSAVSKTVQSFARDLGLRMLRLDTMEAMTLEEALAGKGYLERMRQNLEALMEGFRD
jgi:zinc transport system substrate-binding protein